MIMFKDHVNKNNISMSSLEIKFLMVKMVPVGFVDLLEPNIFVNFKSVDTNTYLALKLLTC